MKKVTDLGPNEAIHCPTHEEAIAICKLMNEEELKWSDGTSYLDDAKWYYYKENTCYLPKDGMYGSIYFLDDYTIRPATDFIPTESAPETNSIPIDDVFKVLDTVQMLPWAMTGDEAIEWVRKLLNEYKQKAL